jgi:hypothetical protein
MEKQLTLDDPQERLNSLNFKIGWLSAMIDGEGSISLTIQQIKGRDPYLVPNVCISGTDISSMERTMGYLRQMDIPYYIFTSTKKGTKMSINPKSQSTKDCSTIRIWGMKRANKFLELISPYLIEKKKQAECVYGYSCRRIIKHKNMMSEVGKVGKLQSYPLEIEDIIDYWNIRRLNNTVGKYKNSKSSESIRRVTYEVLKNNNKLMMYSELVGDNKK